jgi:hypothetical protein
VVALAGPTEVLVAADTPQEVLAWLAKHERQEGFLRFFRVVICARDGWLEVEPEETARPRNS